MSADVAALATDELIDGKYRIVRFLGKGASASVYEGVNVRLRRRVAIKVLGAETLSHPGVVERFEREGQAATQIESDHVVDIFDIGSLADGRPYMVMELLDGEDLGRVLEKRGTLTPERAVYYAVQALRGLADAHAAGVLHRDIKPANVVLVMKQGEEIIKIVDFGISKLHSGAVPQPSAMTQTNAVLGSPVYMSPEQCRGARLMDHRSDLYSLGVVLYEAVTGQVPHIADTFNALMFKIALEDVPDPRKINPDLDPGLAAIICKSLARDTSARYQSALEFRAALVAWADEKGFDPASWPSGSVRNVLSAGQSGAAPRSSGGADFELAKSGQRQHTGGLAGADTIAAPASSTDPLSGTGDSGGKPTAALPAADRRPLVIAAGAAALVLIVALALALTRRSPAPPEERAAAVTPTTSIAAPETAAPATAAPEATATADAPADVPAATASAPPAPSASPIVRRPTSTPARGPAPSGARSAPSSVASTPASAAPPTSSTAKIVIDGRTIHTTF